MSQENVAVRITFYGPREEALESAGLRE